jgi:hypothetical protein
LVSNHGLGLWQQSDHRDTGLTEANIRICRLSAAEAKPRPQAKNTDSAMNRSMGAKARIKAIIHQLSEG